LKSSVEDFLAPKAGPKGEFPAVGTKSPAQQGRARAETMGAAARDYYRLQGEDPDQHDYQRGKQDFEFISRTFGDPRPVDLPVTVRKWLFDLEETKTLKEQEMAVRGMKRFWLMRRAKAESSWDKIPSSCVQQAAGTEFLVHLSSVCQEPILGFKLPW